MWKCKYSIRLTENPERVEINFQEIPEGAIRGVSLTNQNALPHGEGEGISFFQ